MGVVQRLLAPTRGGDFVPCGNKEICTRFSLIQQRHSEEEPQVLTSERSSPPSRSPPFPFPLRSRTSRSKVAYPWGGGHLQFSLLCHEVTG